MVTTVLDSLTQLDFSLAAHPKKHAISIPSLTDTSFLAAAFLLPFGSGSAPAAKGVITEMCSESQRADALNAVTLVENIARLTTQGLFGFVFAQLAETGNSYATFFCNAAVAVLGMGVLLFSHFPPAGSKVVDAYEDDHESECNPDENFEDRYIENSGSEDQ